MEEIDNIDKVNFYYIKDNYLYVYTHNLYAYVPEKNKWYDIGIFKIRVYIGSDNYSTDYTTAINLKHRIYGYEADMNAPHVFRNGNMCHGNLTQGLASSYAEKDYFGVVFQIIMFLESVNVEDVAGAKVDHWPEVTEEEATRTPGADPLENDYTKKYKDVLADALSVI